MRVRVVTIAATVLVALIVLGASRRPRVDSPVPSLWAQTLAANGFRSLARYGTEEEAVAAGKRKGLGSAVLEGPREVEVDTYASWILRFTVGAAGMKPGGGIRLAFAHGMFSDWGGHHLQASNAAGENHVTAASAEGARFRITPKPWRGGAAGPDETFRRYHPWQFITELVLENRALAAGEVIAIGIGDRAGGGPGVRLPQRDETSYVFKLYVDSGGDDDYLPLEHSPAIRIRGAAAERLVVHAPAQAAVGEPVVLTAWVSDRFANPASGFAGTVRLESVERDIALPQPHRFAPGDGARHRFEGIVFRRPGVYRLSVASTDGVLRADAPPIEVRAEPPAERLFFGDIHTHTSYSDGRGTVAETYEFGRDYSALDFCSVTDHSFLVSDRMWGDIKRVTNRFNSRDYVTFLAYEWSGMTDVGGDHNVYFRDGDGEITRCYSYYNYRNLRMYHGPNHGAGHVEELFRVLSDHFRNNNILAIPHYGGRRGNPEWHNPKIQRLIEVFSDHRRSEDWARTFLDRRYRIGIMASTDNHAGNAGYGFRKAPAAADPARPGEDGTSLVAVYAPEKTREAIFDALYRRRTYATTGSRIQLDFRVNGRPMGDEIVSDTPPRVAVRVEGTAPIERIVLLRNSAVVYAYVGEGLSARFEYVDQGPGWKGSFYYVRVEQKDGEQAISSPIWVD